jgi:hypothetical protein
MLPPAVEDTGTSNGNAALTDNNNIVNNNGTYNKDNTHRSTEHERGRRYAEVGSWKTR